jgi:hypothetical protein
MKPDGHQRMPVLLMNYMVVNLNYGSVVTNRQDLESLEQIVNTFINIRMFEIVPGETQPKLYDLTGSSLPELTRKK